MISMISILLMENDFKYVAVDVSGVLDLKVIDHYQNKNWRKLRKINKTLHEVNDISIQNRVFWSGHCMTKIFEEKDMQFIAKINTPRNTKTLGSW